MNQSARSVVQPAFSTATRPTTRNAGRFVLGASMALALAGLSGCVVAVGNTSRDYSSRANDVTSPVMDDLIGVTRYLEPGTPTDEVLALYPPHVVSKFSAAQSDAGAVEEFRVLAYDRRRNSRFERWLYFVDGELSAFDSARIEGFVPGYADPAD